MSQARFGSTGELETVTFNLELNVEQAYSEVRKLETALFRVLSMARRAGLPEDLSRAFTMIQRQIMTVRMLTTALVALNMALSAGSPAGVLLAITGFAGVGFSMVDTLAGY